MSAVRFFHNPLSFICAECGEVTEIKRIKGKTERELLVRCHTKMCGCAGKWYRIDMGGLAVYSEEVDPPVEANGRPEIRITKDQRGFFGWFRLGDSRGPEE